MKPYFESKMEKPPSEPEEKEELRKLIEKLNEPLFEADFSEQKGEVAGKVGEAEFAISFEKCPSNILSELAFLNKDKKAETSPESWKKLKDLCIKIGEKEHSLSEVLPQDWRVVFNPGVDFEDREAAALLYEKIIYLTKPITSVGGLVGLAHEVSHVAVDQIRDEEEVEKRLLSRYQFECYPPDKRKITAEAASDVVRDEREAWSLALKILRPLMKAGVLKKDDLEKYIHNVALASYSKRAKQYIENGLMEK